jgi:cytochrome c peroxidase
MKNFKNVATILRSLRGSNRVGLGLLGSFVMVAAVANPAMAVDLGAVAGSDLAGKAAQAVEAADAVEAVEAVEAAEATKKAVAEAGSAEVGAPTKLLDAGKAMLGTAVVAAVARVAYVPAVPLGLDADALMVPEDNPITPAKIKLGKLLYFDGRLSRDGTISCASCHAPAHGFADPNPTSTGVDGGLGGRNSPTVINTAYGYFQFWDGRSPSLEDQAKGPIENSVEMAMTHEAVVEKISGVVGYQSHFIAAFGDATVDIDRIAKAIATYERTVLSGNSAYDRYVHNKEEDALSDSAKRGLVLFEGKANCTRCHVGFNFADGIFHNLGVGMDQAEPDLGRFVVTNEESDKGAFKTPTLRDISRTAPYMHDGSVATLEEVVELYVRGGEANQWLDPKMVRLSLSETDKADLVAFMLALDGDWAPFQAPVLPQ